MRNELLARISASEHARYQAPDWRYLRSGSRPCELCPTFGTVLPVRSLSQLDEPLSPERRCIDASAPRLCFAFGTGSESTTSFLLSPPSTFLARTASLDPDRDDFFLYTFIGCRKGESRMVRMCCIFSRHCLVGILISSLHRHLRTAHPLPTN